MGNMQWIINCDKPMTIIESSIHEVSHIKRLDSISVNSKLPFLSPNVLRVWGSRSVWEYGAGYPIEYQYHSVI